MEDRRTASPVRTHRIPRVISTAPAPEPVAADLLARALAEFDDASGVLGGPSAGYLTFTAPDGTSVTAQVGSFAARKVARVLHAEAIDLEKLTAGAPRPAPSRITATGRRSLYVIAGGVA